jgi:[FeFe] hydrogenase H-cluster maturation GTPase HydF
MMKTPKGMRVQIGLFGRRNVGKSSILNTLTGQNVSIVSEVAGTTTDPVEKPMELLPIGPVLFIDTAGIDDTGDLGRMRTEKTATIFDRTDIALIVAEAGTCTPFEVALLEDFKQRNVPTVLVWNKCDQDSVNDAGIALAEQFNAVAVQTSATTRHGIVELRQALLDSLPEEFFQNRVIAADLVPPGELAVLVVPIDLEAPRGRLILPQVQTIRDLLDNDNVCAMVKERELRGFLDNLRRPPALVITDSQAFLKVSTDTPKSVPMTSFSILFARLKGDLETFTKGAMHIDKLTPGSRVLIAEACTHHPVGEDIGRVKIPRWLTQYVGGELDFTVVSGHDFPSDLSSYELVVHCGSCTFNRRELLSRILRCGEAGVPITNYGITMAYALGIFERALAPFPNVAKTISKRQ